VVAKNGTPYHTEPASCLMGSRLRYIYSPCLLSDSILMEENII
jgi:hypothetical protein